jgi:glycosyltransferase involved in cell wall biosynthesis
LALYRPFLRAALDNDAGQEDFTLALRGLFDFAQQRDLTAALQSDAAISLLSETWGDIYDRESMTMLDAVQATELMEHFLRPLSAPVVRADLCHAVSNGLPALLALAAKWTYGTPMVMSEHGVYLRERYLAFRNVKYRWPVKTVVLALFRRLCAAGYAAADAIAPVNVYNQRWETRHGADPDTIATAFNGILAADYPAAQTEPETPTIGWVGRVDPLKDLATLIRAFALVHERVPAAVLRLFGPTPAGNEWYEDRLRVLIDELDLEAVVTFEGPIRPVTRAYGESTVVALSSISEGLPYTVMEAMMCGRATVSTEVGGVPELVGDAGMLAPPHDPEAFAEACAVLLADDALRHRMATDARERALGLFQLGQMLETFRGVYRRVTPSRSTPTVSELRLVAAP